MEVLLDHLIYLIVSVMMDILKTLKLTLTAYLVIINVLLVQEMEPVHPAMILLIEL